MVTFFSKLVWFPLKKLQYERSVAVMAKTAGPSFSLCRAGSSCTGISTDSTADSNSLK